MNKQYLIHWILVVVILMVTHILKVCIVGFCSDELITAFQPCVASIIFTFAVASFLAEFQLCGEFVNRLPIVIRLLLDILVYLLIANVALRLFWIPFSESLKAFLVYLNGQFSKGPAPFQWLAKNISADTAYTVFSILTALLIYILYLHSIDVIDAVQDLIRELTRSRKKKGCVTFSDPVDDQGSCHKRRSKTMICCLRSLFHIE